MTAARMLALVAAYAAGVLVAEAATPSVPAAAWAAAASLAAAVLARRAVVPVLVGGLALGLALTTFSLATLERAALARGAAAAADALLEGEAMTDAVVDAGGARFVVRVARAEIDAAPVRINERAVVTIRPPPETLPAVGDILRLDARLAPLFFDDMDRPGHASARRLLHRGIAARAFAGPDGLEVVGRSRNPIVGIADAGRAAVRRAAAHVPARDRGLLLGVTIGDVSLVDERLALDFRVTGLTHLLAVSGANVAIVLGAVVLVLRALGVGRRAMLTVLAACLISFMAITRFEPSVLRAGTMAAIAIAGLALGARRAATNALAVAALILLVHDPFLVHSAGFQLSALATLGILVLAPRIASALPPGRIAGVAAVTLGAQVAVAPLLVAHFHQLSIASIAANLLAQPAVAPATIIGMTAAALGAIWPPLARLAVAATPALDWMRLVARALAQLPYASLGTPRGAMGLVVSLVLIGIAVGTLRIRGRVRAGSLVVVLALVAAAVLWGRALTGPPLPAGVVITMIDVGQGEAIVVRAGERTMVIDGGPDEARLLEGLRGAGVHRIDLLVLTHPHEDHVAGLVPVAQGIPVGRVLDPGLEDPLSSYAEFLAAVRARALPRDRAIAGASYALGPAVVDVLWPPREHLTGTGSDLNNNSVVLRLRFGADVVLFAGETEEAAQQELLARPELLRARVLKVSHHGSARMVPAFYEASGAEVALIPVGYNSYGHPTAQTLAALAGMRVLRSDVHGTSTVVLDGRGGLEIRTEHPQATAAA